MAKLFNGMIPFASAIKPTGAQPLDDRTVVKSFADLLAEDTFGLAKYNGMLVTVVEDKQVYMLTDASNSNIAESWVAVGSNDVKNDLANVTEIVDGISTDIETIKANITEAQSDIETLEETVKNINIPVLDVEFNGQSVVDENGVASIEVVFPDYTDKFNELEENISRIPRFKITVVESLPAEDISETTVYLVKDMNGDNNLYSEYIYVNGEWEILGKYKVDLTNYYTKEEVDALGGNDIAVGEDIKDGETIIHSADKKISTVLQEIQANITEAKTNAYTGVIAGNGIDVKPADSKTQQVVSVKVSTEEGNLITSNSNGIYAAMYYEGDDIDPDEPQSIDYKSVLEKGGKITLENDYEVVNSIVLSNVDTVVDLNNKAVQAGLFTEQNGSIVKGDSDSYVFWVKDGATLELNGDGIVQSQPAAYSMAVWAQGGTVTINGGTYINAGEGSDLIYASNGGKVYIYDGIFKPCEIQTGVSGTSQKYCALNIKDKDREISEIKVYGGTFYGFNPANNTSEGPDTNFVADGYESVEIEPGVWKVISK